MRARALAGALGLVAVLASAGAVACCWAVGWTFDEALDAFVVSNLLIGLGFALCGTLIAWHRPSSALGWMYAVGGVCQTLSALAVPLAQLLHDSGAATSLVRSVLTVAQWGWPVNITLIPLSLLLLPDGRLASPRWRPLAVAVAVTAPLFVLEVALGQQTPDDLPAPYLLLPEATYDSLGWLWTLSEIRWVLSVLAGVVCLVVRYRTGSEVVRRQLLWLVAAAAVILVAVTPWALVAGTPLVVLFTIPLLPVAVTIAVLRHQLLDIRLVVARGLTYALLSGLVLAAYAALVVVLSGVVSALVVALLALPLRNRLQVMVDRMLYGDRGDPLTVAHRVGHTLGAGLPETLEEVRTTLRLPYVGVRVDDRTIAESGEPAGTTATLSLEGAELVVGLRAGERSLGPADARVLHLLAGPLATAVQATVLLDELRVSRERLLVAREDERRRLRRDLHDGLGPLLTGVALSADTASNLAAGSSGELQERLTAVRSDTRSAIQEVRRILDNLGPPALDELGLVEALRSRADQVHHRADGAPLRARVEADRLPTLPPAVEQALYRIATEALNNVVKHSSASSALIRLCADAVQVHCDVLDDGARAPVWRPGLGIAGMRERVALLGGHEEIGPGRAGGQVRVSLPLVLA